MKLYLFLVVDLYCSMIFSSSFSFWRRNSANCSLQQYQPLSACLNTNCKRRKPLTHTHTHTFNGPFSGTTHVSRYQKGEPVWILLEQQTVSSSGISWAICKSAPHCRQITTPAPHHSVFYRPDALPATQPTASKHWRQKATYMPVKSTTMNIYMLDNETRWNSEIK